MTKQKKLLDITKFAVKPSTSAKEELTGVYVVKNEDGSITYTATDSYMLLEVTDKGAQHQELLKTGFYTIDEWKAIVKSDDNELVSFIGEKERKRDWIDYKKIMPGEKDELEPTEMTVRRLDFEMLMEAWKVIKKEYNNNKYRFLDGLKSAQNGRAVYSEENSEDRRLKFILMGLYK